MPKINKSTIFTFTRIPTLKIYQFDKSTNYFCSFYVGTKVLKSGNKELSLKTKNINEAKVKAKQVYYDFFNSPDSNKSKVISHPPISSPFIYS